MIREGRKKHILVGESELNSQLSAWNVSILYGRERKRIGVDMPTRPRTEKPNKISLQTGGSTRVSGSASRFTQLLTVGLNFLKNISLETVSN